MEKELIILAIYINVHGMSRQQAQQSMHELISNYDDMYKDVNKDIKTYWFPVTDNEQTRVECIYPVASINSNIDGIIESELIKIYKALLNGSNEEAKDIIMDIERKLKLNKLKNNN